MNKHLKKLAKVWTDVDKDIKKKQSEIERLTVFQDDIEQLIMDYDEDSKIELEEAEEE